MTSRGICQSVGVSSRKGEHFPFLNKNGGHKNKACHKAPLVVMPENDCKISEEQARSALLTHIADHCCYGKSAAKNMNVKTMECKPAFHYELQTFSEKRETAWTYAGGFFCAQFYNSLQAFQCSHIFPTFGQNSFFLSEDLLLTLPIMF